MNTIELSQNVFFWGHTWFPCSGGSAWATAACRRCSAPAAGSGRWPWTPARDFRCADSPQHRPSAAPVNAHKIHTDKERWYVPFADVHHSMSVSLSGGRGPLRVIKVVRLWARSTKKIRVNGEKKRDSDPQRGRQTHLNVFKWVFTRKRICPLVSVVADRKTEAPRNTFLVQLHIFYYVLLFC